MADHWIRVHARLSMRPVAMRLAPLCEESVHKAIGHLVTFWGNVSAHARQGSVADYSDDQLERWGEWDGKRGEFARWLRAHHLDKDGRVNEWDDYQGALEERRAADRDRKRAERMAKKSA